MVQLKQLYHLTGGGSGAEMAKDGMVAGERKREGKERKTEGGNGGKRTPAVCLI